MSMKLIQNVTPGNIIQASFIADALISHIQGYIGSNYEYVWVYGGLTILQIILSLVQLNCAKENAIIDMFICVLRGASSILAAHWFHQPWLFYVGIQLVVLIEIAEIQHNTIMIIFIVAHLINLGLGDADYVVIGIVKTIIQTFMLLGLISFKSSNISTQLLEIILNKQQNGCTIWLLNSEFTPLVNHISFTKLLESRVKLQNHNSQQGIRIFTPRNELQNKYKQTNDAHGIIKQASVYDQEMLLWCTFKELLSSVRNDKLNHLEGTYYQDTNNIISITPIKLHTISYYYVVETSMNQISTEFDHQGIQFVQLDKFKKIMKQVQKVSHDMRTPLNAVINMQVCLKEFIDPQLVDRYLKPSLNSCRLLLSLINDILDSAQNDNSQIRTVIRKFNLKNLLSKTIQIFDLQIEKRNISINYSIDPKIPRKINSDKNRIRQILINLLSNAIKYTQEQGSILIDCQLIAKRDLSINVTDTGMGIKEENLALLFKDFSKVTDTNNLEKNPYGVGLGLQISNDLVKLLSPEPHRGIEVTSTYGTGSCFKFNIYLHPTSNDDYSQSILSESEPQQQDSLSKKFMSELNNKMMYSSQSGKGIYDTKSYLPQKSKILVFQQCVSKSIYQLQPKLKSSDLDNSVYRKTKSASQQIATLVLQWDNSLKGSSPVLIVDDNEFNIMALQYLLESMDILSDSAISGEACLNMVEQRKQQTKLYSLIFMDIQMPGQDGIETTKMLLNIDDSLKIVACSANTISQQQLDEYLSIGMYGAIEKPVNKLNLRKLLCRLAERQESFQFGQ